LKQFIEELNELKERLLDMGAKVDWSVRRSVTAVLERNESLAGAVLADEPEINRMEMATDELASRLLALNQPVAKDLRFLIACIKIVKDLERMGDLAVNIAQRAISLSRKGNLVAPVDVDAIAQRVETMVAKSLEALANVDESLARGVLVSDDEVDELRSSAYRKLIALMEEEPQNSSQDLDFVFVVHSLERIADHATNIAEDVLHFVRGVDVRHHSKN
jgi:phosphate transport system protein